MKRMQRAGLAAIMLVSVVFTMGAEVIRTYTIPDPDGGPDRTVTIFGLTTIAEVNQNDANGTASMGEQSSQVTVRGVVQSATGDLDPKDVEDPSAWFYISDGTGSLAITRELNAGGIDAVAVGDFVEIATTIFTQRSAGLAGTRTLDFTASFFSDHLTVLDTGRAVNAATLVTLSELVTNGSAHEGALVTVDGVSVVDAGEWPLGGQSGFVRVTDGVTTLSMFIDDDTNLDGITAPAGSFSLTGFVSQDDPNGTPLFEGHFIFPRSTNDIAQGDGDGTAVVTPNSVDEGTAGVTLLFSLAGEAATLTAVELDVPGTWTWSGSAGDVTLGGAGFVGASAPVVTTGTRGGSGWQIRVDTTSLSATDTGTIQLTGLGSPAAEFSEFTVRTSAGGPATAITSQPVVEVQSVVLPGEIVINEILPFTTGAFDEGEFIELHNRTNRRLVIEGWTLQDIGRTSDCVLDARWSFPEGTAIPARSFVVVCRDALKDAGSPNPKGFLVDFPSFPGSIELLEMFDANGGGDFDDPGTANMILLDDVVAEDNQIVLLGGPNTNSGQCVSSLVPFALPQAEVLVLKNAVGVTIDAVSYEEPVPCDGSLCDVSASAGSPYLFGAPGAGSSLGRNAVGADSNDSSADLRPATVATPGEVNQPGDTESPILVESIIIMSSGSVLDIHFDEVVDEASATNPANYSIVLDGERGTLPARTVISDRVEPFRHYVIVTDPLPPGATGILMVDGVTDLIFDGQTPNAVSATAVVRAPGDAIPICEIQTFDDRGFSPYDGEAVTVAGFVTILPTSTDRFGIWVQEPGEGGCGINVFSFDAPAAALGLELNDVVRVSGRVTEFVSSSSGAGAITEISLEGDNPFALIARAANGPTPRLVSTHDANDEVLEGTLIQTSGTVINANSLAAYIDDGTGSIQVFQNFSAVDLTRYTVGDVLQVTGIITQFDSTEPFLGGYELVPQNQDALIELDGTFAQSGPTVEIGRAVLVPELGEEIRISVTTPRRSDVIIEIYHVTGRKVTTLYDGIGLGLMTFDWDGVGQDGSTVEPGAYMCHVRVVALDGGSVLSRSAPIVVGMRLN